MSVLGRRPAASDSSSPRQGVGEGPDRRSKCKRRVPRVSGKQKVAPLTDAHRPRSARRQVRTWPPGCVSFVRLGKWMESAPLPDAHHPRSARRHVRTWPPGCVRFFVSPAGCREWSSSSPSRSSRQFLPERLGQFLRGQVPAPPRTGSISPSKKERKEVERKPQPLETIGLIRCISLPENRTGDRQPKEERGRQARGKGKGAAASVQTITKKMVGMSTGQ